MNGYGQSDLVQVLSMNISISNEWSQANFSMNSENKETDKEFHQL